MYVGQSLRRDEDYRLLTGRGQYTDDIPLPDVVHAAFVRSPHAHARMLSIDTTEAARMPGVLLTLTGEEWDGYGLGRLLPCITPVPFDDGRPMNEVLRPILARDKVHHVGDTVAVVVAETPAQALDAAEAVWVEYEDLPVVTDVAEAADPTAAVIHEQFGTNVVFIVEHGDAERTEEAFARAHHVTKIEMRNARITGNPMEPRAYLGHYDPATGRYTLYGSMQCPHPIQRWIAEYALRVPINRIRVVAPDVGGGFGPKAFFYPEQPVVLWASRLVGRPVRWTATRQEGLMTDTHARDHATKAQMAFDREGRVLGMRVDTVAGFGAYQSNFNAFIPGRHYPMPMVGLYRTPTLHVKVTGVYTNGTPIDAYRGSTQSATTVNERLFENGAREMGIDPAEMRLRNYIQKDEYPYTTPVGVVYDSGNPPGQHQIMMELADYGGVRSEQKRLRAEGVRMGIGLAAMIETSGMGPSRQLNAQAQAKMGFWEVARVHVHPDGMVTISAGTHSHGQSHDITFRQVAADALGIDIADIDLQYGDTDRDPGNFGTAAARSISVAGMAIVEASTRIIAKGTKLAAHLMECAEADLAYEVGHFQIKGTDRRLSFAEVAEMANYGADYPEEGFELGLEETVSYDPVDFNYPTALHLAVVLVDDETGRVTLRDFYCVDDAGRIVNPMVVHGQVHGGAAQGIGQAMMERVVYDPDSGQLLAGSFMDYTMPRADDLPSYKVAFQETLNPNNVLGVKGCSESGSCGPTPAIGNAIVDALWDLGVRHVDQPYLPERVWNAIQVARRPGV